MPKKSTKSKSKRTTLKQKYKVIKKVKEHHRNKRKEAKKNLKKGIKPKEPKDPGLPSQWPFKEELVKEFAWKRAQILADEKRKKDEKKARRMALAGDAMVDEGEEGQLQMAALQAQAAAKGSDFETRKRARLTEEFQSTDKDNSRKAYFKEFRKVVELADVVIQVLDARDPLGCRCPDVESYVRSISPNKKIILLLNKMDLVPREAGEKWLKYFREELPCVAFKCSTQQQGTGLKQGRMPSTKSLHEGLTGAGCLGADTLLAMLKNYCRNADIKTAITVGIVGLPNVGKSSLINSLKRSRAAQVGNTPGVTKAMQEVHLDKFIKLLDSPGVVFADAENEASAALRNAIKAERLDDPVAPVAEIVKRVPSKQLVALYKIPAFKTADELLAAVAGARGKLRKGGVPDIRAASRIILQDWNDGRIPYYTVPPSRGNKNFESASVVGSWAHDFDAEQVFAAEQSAVIAQLPSMDDDAAPNFFEAPSAGAVHIDKDALMEEEDKGALSSGDDDDEGMGAGPSGQDAMDDDDEYGAPAKKPKQGILASAAAAPKGSKVSDMLYGADGQLNPHAARQQRKKLKKQLEQRRASGGTAEQSQGGGGAGDDDEDSDFEFEA
eukprot:CAMPEP_0202412058 /NCGR_PEP_ID=MMETSP1128-20130828/24089_1 /ASSEMBLY_ACC=CAM_ASM_000463 /TAXON_ID=3047 /ORGANISM="Dunaliella tertiolecta, Strain CCMP1320" /LENGTH=610 /DNA_ID=CAMNT_0049017897 /DNA_START=70 /DNA_END=1899 /DNA_ORIENTATION=+